MSKPYPKEHPLSPLLHAVARAVEDNRFDGNLSRRKLAEMSGVSERFIADIEKEAANPSLGSLLALASALKITVPEMLHADVRLTPRLGALLAGRPKQELEAIADLVEARDARTRHVVRHVALIGLRGAGKTTIGRLLAKQLIGRELVELDQLVEERAQLPLAQVFEVHGEARYRQYEREALRQVLALIDAKVIATGGGIVSDPETLSMLLAGARTVWLKTTPEEHLGRVLKQGDKRPMERRPHALQELKTLLQKREPFYAQAELTVDTTGVAPAEVATKIAHWLAKNER